MKFPLTEWLVITDIGRYYFPTRIRARRFLSNMEGEIIKVTVSKSK